MHTHATDGMRSMRGSVFWMAPEVVNGTGHGAWLLARE
jgi:hypothetical protein